MGSLLQKNSESVRKRINAHAFENEQGDEYEGSKFGGFSDYFRRKKIKLQNLDADVRSSSTAKPQVFRGVVAHVNGYTQPSLNDLHHLIVSHGGGFMQYLDGKTTVTHIVASTLTPKKAIEFKRYRIVKPAWVVDSVKAGKLLPWADYRVLGEGAGQRVLGFHDGKTFSQENTQQRGYRDQTNTSWYTNQVKNVAEGIDDDEGPQFPNTQVQTLISTKERMPEDDLDPVSSGGFDVTSSLEDALNQAAKMDAPSRKTPQAQLNAIQDPAEQPPSPEMTSKGEQSPCPAFAMPSKGQPALNSRKRSHDPDTPSPSNHAKAMTAEEHNAILLADPHIRKSSTANPDFIRQYYSESRLHHLSTWKADLKAGFQKMAAEKSASQKQTAMRKPGARRYVMHVDFDSFFCAVSLKSAPEYVDKPAVVAHGSGTGSEIASCNYPARAFGVKNGMWMKNALKLCPDIKVLPYNFPAYEEASKEFYEAILDVGGIVQSVSVDEALVDITSLCLPAGGTDGFGVREGSIWREQEKADEVAKELRKRIKEKTGCAVSVGIGGNILLAKVALRKAKPAGQHQIKPEEIMDFIGELSVQDLPGVAYSIGGKLEEIGVKFVKDVRQLTKERLITVLGPKIGEKIWDYSRGIDRTEVGEQVVRKSVSAEVNWGIRFISQPEAEEFVQNLCNELQRRLIEQMVKGKQMTMKIMKKAADAPLDPPKHLGHGKYDTYNKSIILGVATNNGEIIGREAISILRSYGFSPGELRGLGIQMTKLEPVKSALPEGSQRRINFGTSALPKLAKEITHDPINDPETPSKPKDTTIARRQERRESIDDSPIPSKLPFTIKSIETDDPIDESSPLKAKDTPVHPAALIARANAHDHSARKLNLTGTQFIIPTQIDPEVLKELPQDIRTKLIAQSKNRPLSRAQSPAAQNVRTPVLSRGRSPAIFKDRDASIKARSASPAMLHSPLPSQLDPEVFSALPPSLQSEILASYKQAQHPPSQAQSLLPQSPRKIRTLTTTTTRKPPTPIKKRGRGRPPKFANTSSHSNSKGLIQSNFVSNRNNKDLTPDTEDTETLDPDFLAALPPEMQEELLAEARRKRLAKLNLSHPTKSKRRGPEPPIVGRRRIRLPDRKAKPTFTTRNFSTLEELRGVIRDWYREFEEEGPNEEDVKALERYLGRVVREEKDVGKCVAVVKWLDWLVDDNEGSREGKESWGRAVEGIKDGVQGAVKDRGWGRLDF